MKTTAHEDKKSVEEKVARKAFELYENRGRENGHDQEDWYQAQKMLDEELHQRK